MVIRYAHEGYAVPNAPRDETKELYVDLGLKQMPDTFGQYSNICFSKRHVGSTQF